MANSADLLALHIIDQLPEERRHTFHAAFQARKKGHATAFVLSLFFGFLGIDRFFLGHVGLGLAKMFTFGACGMWWFVDLFFIMSATEAHNLEQLDVLRLAYGALPHEPGYPRSPYPGGFPPRIGSNQPPPSGGFGPPPSGFRPAGRGYGPPQGGGFGSPPSL